MLVYILPAMFYLKIEKDLVAKVARQKADLEALAPVSVPRGCFVVRVVGARVKVLR